MKRSYNVEASFLEEDDEDYNGVLSDIEKKNKENEGDEDESDEGGGGKLSVSVSEDEEDEDDEVEFEPSINQEEEQEQEDQNGNDEREQEHHETSHKQSKREEMLTMFVKKPSLSRQLHAIIQNAEVGRTISRSSRYSKHHKLHSKNGRYDAGNGDDNDSDGDDNNDDDDADAPIENFIAEQSFIHVTRRKEIVQIPDTKDSTDIESKYASAVPRALPTSATPHSPCLEFDRVCMDALEAPLAAELKKLRDFVSSACRGARGALPLVPVAVVSTGLGASDYEFMMDRVRASVGSGTRDESSVLVEINLPLYGTPKDLVKFTAQRLSGGKKTAVLLVRNVEGCRGAPAAVSALVSLLYEERQRCSAVLVLGVNHAAGLDLETFLEHSPAAALALPKPFALSSATTVMDIITRRILAQWSNLPSTHHQHSSSSAVGPNLLRYALRFYFERSGSVTGFVTHLRQGLQLASRTAVSGGGMNSSISISSPQEERKARRRLMEFALLFRVFCHFCSPRDNTTQVLYRTLSYGRMDGVQSAAEAVKLAQTRTSDRAHSGDPLAKAWLRTEAVKATRLVTLLKDTSKHDGKALPPGIPLETWASELEASLKNYAAAKKLSSAAEISQITVGELLTREISEQLAGGSLRLLSNSGSSSSSISGGSGEVRRKKWNLTSPTEGRQSQQPKIRTLFFEVFQPLFLLGEDALLNSLRPTQSFLYANDVRGLRCCCGEDAQVSVLRTLTSTDQMEVEKKANGDGDDDDDDDEFKESIEMLAKRFFAMIASKNSVSIHELQEVAGNDTARTDAALDLLLQLGLVYATKSSRNITMKPSFPFSMK